MLQELSICRLCLEATLGNPFSNANSIVFSTKGQHRGHTKIFGDYLHCANPLCIRSLGMLALDFTVTYITDLLQQGVYPHRLSLSRRTTWCEK